MASRTGNVPIVAVMSPVAAALLAVEILAALVTVVPMVPTPVRQHAEGTQGKKLERHLSRPK